jgi:hypothetical protein
MSSNTGGDGTLGPLNSSYVPNPQTAMGELDVDWYTDLVGHGHGYGVGIYPFAKLFWSLTRTYYKLPIGHALPYTDPGERTAQILLLGGGYSDAFPPDYMKQACPNGG